MPQYPEDENNSYEYEYNPQEPASKDVEYEAMISRHSVVIIGQMNDRNGRELLYVRFLNPHGVSGKSYYAVED